MGEVKCWLLVEGPIPPGPGYYVGLTVLADVPLDSAVARDEIFGSVLTVFRGRDFREAISIATRSSLRRAGRTTCCSSWSPVW